MGAGGARTTTISRHLGEKRPRGRDSPEALAWPPPGSFVDHARISTWHATRYRTRTEQCELEQSRRRQPRGGGGGGDGGGGGVGGGADDYRANEIRMRGRLPRA